jgi:hypothetical protein
MFVQEYDNENDVEEFYKAISSEASQAIFPPACCVFVAK